MHRHRRCDVMCNGSIVDFKSLHCELANYVSKFGNWAQTSQQSSQVHFNVWTSFVNKYSYSIIITNSMKYKPFWQPTGQELSIELLISTSNFGAKFPPNFWTWKRNWQVCNELGNRTFEKWLEIDNKERYLFQVISARKGEFETGFERGGQTR